MTDSRNLAELADIEPIPIWEGIRARRVEGERMTLAIVELDPGAVAPEHTHPAEQHGMVLAGDLRFRVGDEERLLRPGGTWRILSGVPHSAVAGPRGAVVIDVFTLVARTGTRSRRSTSRFRVGRARPPDGRRAAIALG